MVWMHYSHGGQIGMMWWHYSNEGQIGMVANRYSHSRLWPSPTPSSTPGLEFRNLKSINIVKKFFFSRMTDSVETILCHSYQNRLNWLLRSLKRLEISLNQLVNTPYFHFVSFSCQFVVKTVWIEGFSIKDNSISGPSCVRFGTVGWRIVSELS